MVEPLLGEMEFLTPMRARAHHLWKLSVTLTRAINEFEEGVRLFFVEQPAITPEELHARATHLATLWQDHTGEPSGLPIELHQWDRLRRAALACRMEKADGQPLQ